MRVQFGVYFSFFLITTVLLGQEEKFVLHVAPAQSRDAEIVFPILIDSSVPVKSVCFVAEYDHRALVFKNLAVGADAPAWKGYHHILSGVPVESPQASQNIFFRLRGRLANTLQGNGKEIGRLVFTRANLDVTPVLTLAGDGAKTCFVISRPALAVIQPEVMNGEDVAIHLSRWRRQKNNLALPVVWYSSAAVRKIKFVVDYDSQSLALAGTVDSCAVLAPELREAGFHLKINEASPLPPASWADRNFEVEIEGAAGQTLTRRELQLATLKFILRDTVYAPKISLNRSCSASHALVVDSLGGVQEKCFSRADVGSSTTVAASSEAELPTAFALMQSYPNPLLTSGLFNTGATVRFAVPRTEWVSLQVYNVLGQLVKTLQEQSIVAGYHRILWRGDNERSEPVRAGIYFVHMRAGNFIQTKRILVLK